MVNNHYRYLGLLLFNDFIWSLDINITFLLDSTWDWNINFLLDSTWDWNLNTDFIWPIYPLGKWNWNFSNEFHNNWVRSFDFYVDKYVIRNSDFNWDWYLLLLRLEPTFIHIQCKVMEPQLLHKRYKVMGP